MIFVTLEGPSSCARSTPPRFSVAYILVLCFLAALVTTPISGRAQRAGCHGCTCIRVCSVAQYGRVAQAPGARSRELKSALLHPARCCALARSQPASTTNASTCPHQPHPPAHTACSSRSRARTTSSTPVLGCTGAPQLGRCFLRGPIGLVLGLDRVRFLCANINHLNHEPRQYIQIFKEVSHVIYYLSSPFDHSIVLCVPI